MHHKSDEFHDIRTLCSHLFPTGSPCGSPALRGQPFCYHHHPTRRRVANPNERRARRIARQSFPVTLPTNPLDLQQALNEVILRVATNQIDTRRAGLLLFALQIAGKNLPALSEFEAAVQEYLSQEHLQQPYLSEEAAASPCGAAGNV